jgi:hypothetical protein
MAIPELLKTIALNRLVDQGVRRIDRFYGTDTEREEDEDKGFGFASQQRPGGLGSIIGRALAYSLLGPIAGPLAFAAGRGILARRNQPLQMGLNTMDDIIDDPRGTFTAEGMQFANVQDALGSTDPNKDINYNTGVITDKTTGEEIGNVYDEVALTNLPEPPAYDFDDSSSDSGGSDSYDGASSMDDYSSDPTGYSGSFRYGGLASLYR